MIELNEMAEHQSTIKNLELDFIQNLDYDSKNPFSLPENVIGDKTRF